MLLASWVWRSTAYSLTWEPQATKQGRLYFRLRPSVRRISVSGVLSWPTPDARDSQPEGFEAGVRRWGRWRTMGLQTAAMMWPTPSAQEPGWQHITVVDKHGQTPTHHHQRWYDAHTGRVVQKGLTQVVEKMWPTPQSAKAANDTALVCSGDGDRRPNKLGWAAVAWPTPTSTAGDGRSEQDMEMWEARAERTLRTKGIRNGMPINVAVKKAVSAWPTPTVNGNHNRAGASAKSGNGLATSVASASPTPQARDHKGKSGPNHQFAETLSDKVTGKLNPEWVETLQGFPEGWTEVDELPPAEKSKKARKR